jgi:tRNA (guanine37-N1)-methyltransferase
MFSGIAPYPIIISKNSNAKEIWGIEINPIAHKYAKENIILNKIKNVKLFLGDVNTVLPKMKKRFDRIIMPLPKGAGIFLNLALKKIKKEGIIHFYDFFEKEDITKKAKNKINNVRSEKKFKILDIIKCGQYSPGKYRICIDFRIL